MKILLILCRTLGDVILGNTLVAELKKKYPDCEITFAVWPEYSEIVDSNPDIKGLIMTKEWDVVLAEAVKDRYDLVLCPYQTNHTDTLWHHNPKYKNAHLIDYYAKKCGIEITDRREYVYFKDEDIEEMKKLLDPTRKNLVMHTTSLVLSKNWNKFGELAEKLADFHIIQVGGPKDTRVEKTIDMRGKLSFSKIMALLSKSDMFIGVDSGITYMADAVDCPTICIMGMSTQDTSGPIGKNTHFIEPKRPAECKWPCHSNCRYKEPCIWSISVETVLNKTKEVLENGSEKENG